MSVVKGKQNKSKAEFDNAYFKIYEDCVRMISTNFGMKDISKCQIYIESTEREILKTVEIIGTQIRIANSIFPTCKAEYEERRIAQDKAIGLCYA